MSEFITFYKAASDYKQREKDGLEPLKPYLKEIEDIKDLNDLASKSANLTDKGIPLPFGYNVGTNAENTSQKQIQLTPQVSYCQMCLFIKMRPARNNI